MPRVPSRHRPRTILGRVVNGNGHNPMLGQLAAAAQQPQELPFQPVPTNFSVIAARVGVEEQVLLVVTTPLGQQGYFMPPDIAKQVAAFLVQHATAAASGLTVIGDAGGTPDEAPS